MRERVRQPRVRGRDAAGGLQRFQRLLAPIEFPSQQAQEMQTRASRGCSRA
jgi:hypothetical protein